MPAVFSLVEHEAGIVGSCIFFRDLDASKLKPEAARSPRLRSSRTAADLPEAACQQINKAEVDPDDNLEERRSKTLLFYLPLAMLALLVQPSPLTLMVSTHGSNLP